MRRVTSPAILPAGQPLPQANPQVTPLCPILEPHTRAQAAGRDHAEAEALPQHPPTPLPGYEFTEIAVTADSPVAGRKLADVTWPPGSTPVIVLRGHQLRPPQPELTLASGDCVSLLTVAPGGSPEPDPGSERHT